MKALISSHKFRSNANTHLKVHTIDIHIDMPGSTRRTFCGLQLAQDNLTPTDTHVPSVTCFPFFPTVFLSVSVCQLNRSVELQGGRSSQEENHHAINMVLTMIIAFFVCWLPYTALSVVVVLNPELYIPPLLATMPMYFAKTSPVYNPIIYFLTNKQVSMRHGMCHSRTRASFASRCALLLLHPVP